MSLRGRKPARGAARPVVLCLTFLAVATACKDGAGAADSESGDAGDDDGGDGGDDGPPIPPVGLVCEGSDETDVSGADATISGGDCNETAIAAAVEAGGIVVLDCPEPVVFTREMVVTSDTVIDGSETTVLDGGGTTRLLTKRSGAWLHLQHITLQNGQAPEALGDGSVTQANWFEWAGGAINAQCHDNASAVGGGLTGKNLTCRDNATGSHTRDPETQQILDTGNGGCAYLFACEFQCDECEFSNNRATNGGAIGALGAKAKLTNSTCVGNEARRDESTNDNQGCGGCWCQDGTETGPGEDAQNFVHLCGNVFANNRADDNGGAVSLFYRQQTHTSIRFERNSCQGNESGLSGEADKGGGCFYTFVDPDTKIPWAPDVGPDEFVFSGNAVYENSTHHLGGGAALFNIWNTAVRFDNNVFLRNEVRTTDQSSGGGGALALVGTFFDLEHNSFVGNTAANSIGGVIQGAGGSALRNNLFVNNSSPIPSNGPSISMAEHVNWVLDETDDGNDMGFLVFASGGNLFFPVRADPGGERPTPGAAVTEDAQVGMLVTDDGFPPYLPIPNGSPAVDAGVPTMTVTHDMRGVPRDDAPDIGAFEAMR
ncbi:MAG: choice-of-anchor Q domain-containing protein [Myxococcota bacterium]